MGVSCLVGNMSNPTSFILFLIACFLSVICQGLPRSGQTNDIFGVEYFDDSDDAYFRSENNIGFPPPSYGGDLGVSCDCKQILVSSLGEAQHIQPDSMGVYKYYTSFNGRPAYHKSNGRRLGLADRHPGRRPDWLRASRQSVQLPVSHRRRRLDVRQPGLLVQGQHARRQMHPVRAVRIMMMM